MKMKSLRNTTIQLIALGSVVTFIWVLYAMKIKPHAMSAPFASESHSVSTESMSRNPLHDFEVYVRYTTAGGAFPNQAEAWLFRFEACHYFGRRIQKLSWSWIKKMKLTGNMAPH